MAALGLQPLQSRPCRGQDILSLLCSWLGWIRLECEFTLAPEPCTVGLAGQGWRAMLSGDRCA